MQELHFKKPLFGGTIEFIVYTEEKEKARASVEEAYKEALRLQKIFNFFDTTSELSELNKKRQMQVSKELFEVIETALGFAEITGGQYDVSLGKEILMRKEKGGSEQTNATYKEIKLDKKTRRVCLENSEIILDLGSIAKGYITDRLADFLESKNLREFLIDSRGDIIVAGKSFHVIEIQNPRDKNKNLFALKLKNQAVATSGDYMQFKENFANSHIINQKDLISVTVVAPNLEIADVLATAIFVSDKKSMGNISKKFPEVRFMTIDKNLNKEFFNNMEELLYD